MSRPFSLYVLRCGDGRLYTGISTDVDRRLKEHSDGRRGAKALRGRGRLELVVEVAVGERSAALRAEHHVKRLPKRDKERLLEDPSRFRASVLAAAAGR